MELSCQHYFLLNILLSQNSSAGESGRHVLENPQESIKHSLVYVGIKPRVSVLGLRFKPNNGVKHYPIVFRWKFFLPHVITGASDQI